MADVAILTEKRYLNPLDKNWYTDNILKEESLVICELRRLNIACSRVAWDVDGDLSNFDFFIFRTTWNYFEKLDKFLLFLNKHKARGVTMINSFEHILWNLDKKYLLELRSRGINIPKSQLIKKQANCNLLNIMTKNNWKNAVIKPCVSAAAWNTYRVALSQVNEFENLFKDLLGTHNMLVQDYQKNIESIGEISIVIIDGVYLHAVKKVAKPGDFRVQDDFGGTVYKYSPSKNEIDFALSVVGAIETPPIYARVDIILDNSMSLALSEVELIEPELWFRECPQSAVALAKAIKKRYF